MPTRKPPAPVMLDTHVWIWLVKGDEQFAESPGRAMAERAAERGLLLISAISVWEVGMLESKGRLDLGADPLDWVRKALSAKGTSLVPLTPEIAIESTRLPGGKRLHGDPADRIIAASARLLGAPVVTRDRGLLDYARRGFLAAVEA